MELATSDTAMGQRQNRFSVWCYFCLELFDGDINFGRLDMFLHIVSFLRPSMNAVRLLLLRLIRWFRPNVERIGYGHMFLQSVF